MGIREWTAGEEKTYNLADGVNLIFYWEQYSDPDTNTSSIYWELRLSCISTWVIPNTSYTGKRSVVTQMGLMRGDYQEFTLPQMSNGQTLLATGTYPSMKHNTDGTGDFYFCFDVNLQALCGNKDITAVRFDGDCVLETIPRIPVVTITGGNYIGDTVTFTFSRFVTNSWEEITYKCGDASGTILDYFDYYKESSFTWTIPTSFYNQLNSTTSQITCTFTITSYTNNTGTGGELGTQTISKIFSASSEVCTPLMEYRLKNESSWREGLILKDVNPTTIALTNDDDKMIKYFSTIFIGARATAQKGAYIKSFVVENNGKEILSLKDGTYTTRGVAQDFSNLTDGSFTITAIDSRGFSNKTSYYIKTVDYTKLTCAVSDITFDSDAGVATTTIDGKFFKGMFDTDLPYVGATNKLKIEYRYRINNQDHGSTWTTLYDGAGDEVLSSYNGYKTSFDISGLDKDYAYFVQIRVSDSLMSITLDDKNLTIAPIFNWGKEDFQFNVLANCDKGLTITKQPVADFVIESGTAEMGTNGTWYWQKWNSGRAECYGCRNYGNAAVTTAWGVLYRSEVFNQNLPSGLFLNMPDVVDISFRNSNYGAWIAKHETAAPSETTTGSFIIVRPASATLSQAKISFNVIGRWK